VAPPLLQATDMFFCRKCKMRKCTYYQVLKGF
jgi:hypothetical protein